VQRTSQISSIHAQEAFSRLTDDQRDAARAAALERIDREVGPA
jgi:hypothetical protein